MIHPERPDYANTPASGKRRGYGYAPLTRDATPVVSIITPFFDTDESFLETACSVLGQSLQAWEWIIIDDGSSDPVALERLAQVQAGDSRISVTVQQNRGPAAARNRAFAQAVAPYICLLDSDDMLEPTFIEKCVWFLESNPEFSFCNSWSVNFGEEEFLWQLGFERGKAHLVANSGPPMSVIRRNAFEACGGFDESIRFGHEDWDLWLAMAKAGHWGHTLPEYLEWYRKRSSGRFAQVMNSGSLHLEFENRLKTKYSGLEANFPSPQRRAPEAFEAVCAQKPFANALERREGPGTILFLVPWMVTGGADRVNLDWMELLLANGYQVSVCATLESHHNWHHEFARITPDVFILPNFLRLVDYPRFILHLIQSRGIDTVLVTGSTLGYQLLPYLRSFCPGVSFVDLCHVEEPHWLNGGHPRFGTGYQEALDLNLVTTSHLREWMTGRGASRERIEVCYSGIEIGKPDTAGEVRSRVRASLGIDPGTRVIIFAGRICEQKRPRLLAEILRDLAGRGTVFRALVIGDGELRPLLENLVREYALAPMVQFLGTVEHDRWLEILAASDVFLLPSQYEGISVALLEAMGAGVVPVVAAVGGQAEVITASTGFIVPHSARELENYVTALCRLIAEPETCRGMGEAARVRIELEFSRKATSRRLDAILVKASKLAVSEPRTPVAPGLALELATLGVEYARLTRVADSLWSHWLQTRDGSPAVVPSVPVGRILRLVVALAETRTGAVLLGNTRLRRLGRWLLDRLQARQRGHAAGGSA